MHRYLPAPRDELSVISVYVCALATDARIHAARTMIERACKKCYKRVGPYHHSPAFSCDDCAFISMRITIPNALDIVSCLTTVKCISHEQRVYLFKYTHEGVKHAFNLYESLYLGSWIID